MDARRSEQAISQDIALSFTDQLLLLIYRISTYIAFNVIDDAALLAFGLS